MTENIITNNINDETSNIKTDVTIKTDTTDSSNTKKNLKKNKKKKHRIRVNDQSLGEEIANAISHGVGAGLAIAGTVVLLVKAATIGTAIDVVSSALYGASLIITYLFSCIYHSLAHNRGKKVFQIFDHCSIFLLIWGTYIPVCLSLLHNALGWVLFGIIGLFAVLGIVFNAINLEKWHKISLILYIVMGWLVVFTAKPVFSKIVPAGLVYLLVGGVCYTLGVIFFKLKIKYMHFIWHLFVLAGSILHFFFIYLYVI